MDPMQTLAGTPGAGDLKLSRVVNSKREPLAAYYGLSAEQSEFFKAETGINDDDHLKSHILEVQAKAYKVSIRVLVVCNLKTIDWGDRYFLTHASSISPSSSNLGITTQPEYKRILELGQECPDGVLLDIGCCFGVDARKAVADGFPLKNVVTTDLIKDFFDMGHDLFNTTQATYPISFVAGDAFNPTVLEVVPPCDELPSTEKPDLSTLTSLNPLASHCTVIYVSNFFHLFSEEKQLHLVNALAGLLSPRPGSIICGEQAGNFQEGVFHGGFGGREWDMHVHSPESWSALWHGRVFAKGKVRTDARLIPAERMAYHRLQWSVVRL